MHCFFSLVICIINVKNITSILVVCMDSVRDMLILISNHFSFYEVYFDVGAKINILLIFSLHAADG